MADDYDHLMTFWSDETVQQDMNLQEPGPMSAPLAASRLQVLNYEATVRHLYDESMASLRHQLLGRIHAMPFQFFETLVIDVLFSMGYGARRRDLSRVVGKSGDGGIDGIITQDELGLDLIYVQAKRLRPNTSVPISDVRDFIGSLEGVHANKGILVTTGNFTSAASEYLASVTRRVVLVDGNKLSDLMIRHNLGVAVKSSYQIKEIVPSYFDLSASRSSKPLKSHGGGR